MKTAKLIIDGKEIEVQISDKQVEELTAPKNVGIHNSCYECDALAYNVLTDVHTEGEYGQLKEYGCDDPNIGYYMLCHNNAKFVVIEG